MQKLFLFLVSLSSFLIHHTAFGQSQDKRNSTAAVYTFFVNILPDQFPYPAVGFVNIINGSHQGFQLGFVQITRQDFSGSAVGFVQVSGERVVGNQLGFVNVAAKKLEGLQLGFVNISARIQGNQWGFVNVGKSLKGNQFGFVNIADTLESGLPIGFISVVKKGGYKAFSANASLYSPLQLSFKIGIPRFYSLLSLAMAPGAQNVYSGFGFGSSFSLTEKFTLHPEIQLLSPVTRSHPLLFSATFLANYKLYKAFSLTAGPVLGWQQTNKIETFAPAYLALYTKQLNNSSLMQLGLQAGLRYSW